MEDDDEHDADGEEEEDAEGEDDMDVDVDRGYGQLSKPSDLGSSVPYDWAVHGNSPDRGTPRGTKRPRNEHQASFSKSLIPTSTSLAHRESPLPTAARDLAKQAGPAELTESDGLILETEAQIQRFDNTDQSVREQERIITAALEVVPEALSKAWQSCCYETTGKRGGAYTETIGPGEEDSPLEKATFVGTLLLKLYHPPLAKGRQPIGTLELARKSFANTQMPNISREEAYPKVLVDWLAAFHDPYRTAAAALKTYQPNPTAHSTFWDLVFSATLRGQLQDVLQIFQASDFQYAATAKEDGMPTKGYRGPQLESIGRVVGNVMALLHSCPALRDGDWHVTREQWALFRKRVEAALEDLITFSEGRDHDQSLGQSTFEAENFGIRSTASTPSQSTRRAQSRVPWTVYQNLKLFYGIFLGGTDELLQLAQDWLEASFALTIWWDGNEVEVEAGRASMSRRSLRRPGGHAARVVDSNPGAAYRRRLRHAFETVAEDDGLAIESSNAVEVALASILEGNIADVLGLLRTWSLPITAATMEIGSIAGWYESAPGPEAPGDGFDESDLMVLSYAAATEKPLSRESVLLDYADQLFERAELRHGNQVVEGWEVALALLSRLENAGLAKRKMAEYLKDLSVETDGRADKLIALCLSYDLRAEACEIAEVCAWVFISIQPPPPIGKKNCLVPIIEQIYCSIGWQNHMY